MALPFEPAGYAVNVYTREVHKRHAPHARELRRTTPGGLAGVLHGKEPVPCEECFGKPKAERKTASRTRFTAEPVKVVEKKKAEPKASGSTGDAWQEGLRTGLTDEADEDVEEPDGAPDEG